MSADFAPWANFTQADSRQVQSPFWLACSQPERPPDAYVVWHYESCDKCRFKALVQQSRFPDDPHVAWLVGVITATTT